MTGPFQSVPGGASRPDRVPPAPRSGSERAQRLILARGSGESVFRNLGLAFVAAGLLLGGYCLSEPAPIAYGILTGLLLPTGAASFAWSAWSYGRRKRAFIWGVPIQARVVSLGPDPNVTVDEEHPTRLVWEFEKGGRHFRGSLSTIEKGALESLPQGTAVVVLHLPDRPEVSTIWIE